MPRAPRKLGDVAKGKLRLSLCMIVKNEAQTLDRCLRLARPHVDEIVVVDTGSSDGTVEIARAYADVLDEIAWPDSFSAARNHSLGLASGDYILYLDGDEYIPEPAHWKRLRKALRRSDVAGVKLPVRNLLGEDRLMAVDRGWQVRLFRRHPQIRFTGRVHNQIEGAVAAYMQQAAEQIIRVEAEIIHTGYALAPERMREKYRPRIHLLKAEYERPRSAQHRAYYGYQLGVVYFVLEQFADALAVLEEIDYGLLSPENAFYAHLLAAQAALKQGRAGRALIHCNAMLTLDRREPVAYYTTGIALVAERQVGDGLLMLLEAFSINEAAGTEVRFLLNSRTLLRVLSIICRRAGLKEQAAAFRLLSEKEHPRPEAAKALISTLKTGIVLAEAGGA